MPAFLAQNKKVHSSNKKSYSEKNILMQDLSLTLPQDLTKIDEDIEPFWNSLSTAIHYTLWQPHRIELPEAGLPLSSGLSQPKVSEANYQAGESNFWKSQIIPSSSTPKHLSLSLPASSIPTTETEGQRSSKEGQSVITSKKIRIYPENEPLWFASLNLFRRAYNLTIEFFKKAAQSLLSKNVKYIVGQIESAIYQLFYLFLTFFQHIAFK